MDGDVVAEGNANWLTGDDLPGWQRRPAVLPMSGFPSNRLRCLFEEWSVEWLAAFTCKLWSRRQVASVDGVDTTWTKTTGAGARHIVPSGEGVKEAMAA